jgi:CheY-like chemotaxis protein
MLRGFAKVTRDLTTRQRFEEMQRSQRQTNNFLAMLAHELRNPLDPIRHALDLMALQPADPNAREWAREVIDRQVTQLGRLVDDLLDVSRITSGKITLKLKPTSLEQIVADAVESVRPLATARSQTIDTVVEGRSFECRVDRMRVSQIILNLLTNAVKYTPVGGKISVRVLRAGAFGEVLVSDTGLGMSPELVEQVFEPFVQGERTLDRAEGGLGLGLTLVRRLAEMHGGSVSAESPGEGKGSTFTVRFPVCATVNADEETRPVPSPAPPTSASSQRRVLIVDDNFDAASTLGALVAALGHRVWTVHDGAAALVVATEHHPDTVLLDIGLPGMNGYDVVRKLRAIPGLRQSTIVACTGYSHDSDRIAVRQAGFDEHLVKPIEIDRLQEILQRPPGAPSVDRAPAVTGKAH